MKIKLTILFLIIGQFLFAHQDFYITKDYGNVKIRVKTGFKYEEINKAFIIGQLAEKLAEEMNYKEQIFLDFTHYYLGDTIFSDYFISFDKGLINDNNKQNETVLKEDAIVIRNISNQFNVNNTLKLIEYSIKNLKFIKSKQKKISYKNGYYNWELISLEEDKIKKVINNKQLSKNIRKVYSSKIYRPNPDFKFGFTYYWQEGKYVIVKKNVEGKEESLIELDNIYDFRFIGSCTFIFPTKNEFLTINEPYNKGYKKMISDPLTIKDGEKNYKPYKIEFIGGNKYSIYFVPRDGIAIFFIYDEVKNNLITLKD
ncbi:hypothetical protein [Empedobacter brevis]|uniref:hypothetical protein n=1 Tax=Empedobacter brevis TaxID=247 RepID=UPI002899266D|nr:hypothetical protein [Empedobacter brevis]